MGKNKDLIIICACAILTSIILILGWGVRETSDSESYICAWDNFVRGEIDVLRTPVYPCFLGLMKTLFGEHYYRIAVICMQHIVFIISIYCFHKVALIFIPSKRIAFVVSLCYATFSLLITWNNYILTESFSVSGTVMLTYVIFKMRQSNSLLYALWHFLLLAILVFLRPSFIYMIFVLGCIWFSLSFVKKERITSLCGMTGVVMTVLLLLLYAKAYERAHGIYACSCVNTINQIFVARQYELWNPDVIDNQKLKEHIVEYDTDITSEDNIWNETLMLKDKFDLKTLNDAIYGSYKSNPIKWFESCWTRFIKSMDYYLFTIDTGTNPLLRRLRFVEPTLCFLYVFILIYTTILCVYVVKVKKVPWMSLLFNVLIIGNVVVAIVGAQNGWSRLVRASIPLFLLMVGQLCAKINWGFLLRFVPKK